MEPSNNKRSKLVNIMILIAIVVLCNKSAYTNEQIKVNINSQPKTTQSQSWLKLIESEAKLLDVNVIYYQVKSKIQFGVKLLEQQKNKLAQTDSEFLERQTAMEYTEEDLELLATVMYAEAGICDDKELYRVGNVVLNRVNDNSGQFEDTIKGVIYQKGQFTSVGGKQWNIGPTEREREIAKDVLEGARVLPNNTYWFSKGHRYGDVYYKSDWHYFSGMEL